MVIEVKPFKLWHLDFINLQEHQKHMKELFDVAEYQELLLTGEAHTAFGETDIALIAGVYPLTNYIARAWALIGDTPGRDLLYATRAIGDFLKQTHYDRIETPVMRDFTKGHRWCKALGFINETPEIGMKYYGFNGETYDLYAFYPKEN